MYKTRNLPRSARRDACQSKNTRIDVADALRGIAVAGIILYHSVEHFNIFTQEPIVHPLASDQTVADVLAWLLSGKMYGLFAMLFGLSFFIMNDNQQQKGKSFSGRYAWRMCLLFMFGIINVAFYDGDILMLYACYGLLLIPISYLSSRWVWAIIILLAIQPVELFCLLTGEGVRRVLRHLCIFGRMSLTNYLLQSIIGCFIFCGYGLACYRLLGITYAVMVGCCMVIAQYLFARYWFSNHPRGPLEGLWRKLTWI